MTVGTGASPETVVRPGFLATAEVRVAALMLPTSDGRDRYRHEFVAELYGMSRGRQMHHATQILLSTWALRRAMTADAHRRVAEEASMTAPDVSGRTSKGIWCRLNLHHWAWRSTDDGGRYRVCDRCGKEDFRVSDPGDGNAVPPGAF